MDYLRCFVITFGVFNAAGVVMLTFGVFIILSWLAALFLETFLFLSVVFAVSVLNGIIQVLSFIPSHKVRKSSVVNTLPMALLFLPGTSGHCQSDDFDNKTLATGNSFVFPFTLNEEPMNRLLVASFKDDTEYEGIEPQMFDSPMSKGLKILMYRNDRKVDVYYEPGVRFDEKTFTLGDGLGYTAETVMSRSRFEITENGVDIDIAFRDKSGRNVTIVIRENTRNINPFPFLAPVGENVRYPEKLFAVYMKKFDFVRREGTTVHITVGDRELTPENFPISRDGQKVYLMRYASGLVIGEINASVKKPFVIGNVTPGIVKTGNLNLLVNEDNEVQSCWLESKSDRIELNFREGFPNLLTLPQNREVKGSWQYAVSGEVLFGGIYSLLRDNDKVYIGFDVTKKWKPGKIPFSFKVFTCIVRSFRTWPASYKWTATVDLNKMSVDCNWKRK